MSNISDTIKQFLASGGKLNDLQKEIDEAYAEVLAQQEKEKKETDKKNIFIQSLENASKDLAQGTVSVAVLDALIYAYAIQNHTDWNLEACENFKDSIMESMKILEGLWSNSKGNLLDQLMQMCGLDFSSDVKTAREHCEEDKDKTVIDLFLRDIGFKK